MSDIDQHPDWSEDAHAEICKLVNRNEELQTKLDACEPYLKEGETPAECIQRNRDDTGMVLKMLAKEKRKVESLEADRLCRCADEVRCDYLKRITELEAKLERVRNCKSYRLNMAVGGWVWFMKVDDVFAALENDV